MCGFRYVPQKITFNKKCFGNTSEDRWIPNLITSMKNLTQLPENRVLGGRDVFYRESPWTVQIAKKNFDVNKMSILTQVDDTPLCTGVLLTMRHILTAAHCRQ